MMQLFFIKLRIYSVDGYTALFEIDKCDCDSCDNHGYPSVIGQSQMIPLYYYDLSENFWKTTERTVQVLPSQSPDKIRYRILLTEQPQNSLYLPFYAESFTTKYIIRQAFDPFARVKLWYPDAESDLPFDCITVLKDEKFYSQALITQRKQYAIEHYVAEERHDTLYLLSYWCTRLRSSDFDPSTSNLVFFKTCGFLQPFDIEETQSSVFHESLQKKIDQVKKIDLRGKTDVKLKFQNYFIKPDCIIPIIYCSWIIGFRIEQIACRCYGSAIKAGKYHISLQNEPQFVHVDIIPDHRGVLYYDFLLSKFLPGSLKKEDWLLKLPLPISPSCDCKTALEDSERLDHTLDIISTPETEIDTPVFSASLVESESESKDLYIRLDVSAVFEAGQISLSKFPVRVLKEFTEQSLSFALYFTSQKLETSFHVKFTVVSNDDIKNLSASDAEYANFKVKASFMVKDFASFVGVSDWEVHLSISSLNAKFPRFPVHYVNRLDPPQKFSSVKLWLPETEFFKKECVPEAGDMLVVFAGNEFHSLACVDSQSIHRDGTTLNTSFALSHCLTKVRAREFVFSPVYSFMKWEHMCLDPTTIVKLDTLLNLFPKSTKFIESMTKNPEN